MTNLASNVTSSSLSHVGQNVLHEITKKANAAPKTLSEALTESLDTKILEILLTYLDNEDKFNLSCTCKLLLKRISFCNEEKCRKLSEWVISQISETCGLTDSYLDRELPVVWEINFEEPSVTSAYRKNALHQIGIRKKELREEQLSDIDSKTLTLFLIENMQCVYTEINTVGTTKTYISRSQKFDYDYTNTNPLVTSVVIKNFTFIKNSLNVMLQENATKRLSLEAMKEGRKLVDEERTFVQKGVFWILNLFHHEEPSPKEPTLPETPAKRMRYENVVVH